MKVLTSIVIVATMVWIAGCNTAHKQKVVIDESSKNEPAIQQENSTEDTAKAEQENQEPFISVEALESLLKPTGGIVTKDENGVLKATFKNNITFARQSAKLQEGVKTEIQKIANAVKSFEGSKIRVMGHTDKWGAAKFNMQLSLKRANATKTALIESGYTGEIEVIGFGETQLISENDAENRRVEIELNNITGMTGQKEEIQAENQEAVEIKAQSDDLEKDVKTNATDEVENLAKDGGEKLSAK